MTYLNISDMFIEYSKAAIRTGVDSNELVNSLFDITIPNIIYFINIGVIGRDGRYSIIKYNKNSNEYSGVSIEGIDAAKGILASYKLELENSVTLTNVKLGRNNIFIPFTVLEDLI